MTGADLAWDVLTDLGVSVVFGVPGGAILPLVDAMVARETPVDFIVARHEAAAIHAADGYARIQGKPSVALATSGPGGTNVITGLATAMSDSVPVVLILGQVPSQLIGTDAFQEADLFNMTMPVVKHSWRISKIQDVAQVIEEAYFVAGSGRPGPVVVEFPKDIQSSVISTEIEHYMPEVSVPQISPLSWAKAKSYLRKAERPIIYVGGGVVYSGTHEWIFRLAEKYNAPVTTTLLGLGAFPASHELSLGMLGMHGTWTANHAMQDADLILALGARFDDRVTGKVDEFAPKAKIIHVEVDSAEVNKVVRPDVVLRGDLRDVLPKLYDKTPRTHHSPWIQTLKEWQNDHPLRPVQSALGLVAAPRALGIINEFMQADDIVVTEVGQHQMWAALYMPREKPRTFVTSGGSGTMGYGFPACMGAQVAQPDVRTVLIAGDGSLQMNLQEFATLMQYGMPVWVIVLNNQGHGMVRQWQDLFYDKRRYGVKLMNPDFVKLAEAFGIRGFTANSESGLREALEIMTTLNGPLFLEILVPEDEHVYPMVPAGRPLSMVIEG